MRKFCVLFGVRYTKCNEKNINVFALTNISFLGRCAVIKWAKMWQNLVKKAAKLK